MHRRQRTIAAIVGEFDLIARLAAALGDPGPDVMVPIGDDAALLAPDLVVSTDLLVEDVHFRRATSAPADIGWKALAAAVSDLAAMGAEPVGAVIGLAVGAGWTADEVVAVYDGVAACAAAFRLPGRRRRRHAGAGADAGRHRDRPDGRARHARRRAPGRRPGRDRCARRVGGRAAGAGGRRPAAAGGRRTLAERHRRPRPRLAEGRALAGLRARDARRLRRRRLRRPPAGRGERRHASRSTWRRCRCSRASRPWRRQPVGRPAPSRPPAARTTSCSSRSTRRHSPPLRCALTRDRAGRGRAGGRPLPRPGRRHGARRLGPPAGLTAARPRGGTSEPGVRRGTRRSRRRRRS